MIEHWEIPELNYYNYLRACRAAATNSIEFDTFKRNPHYTTILEHVDTEQGMQYYEYIKDKDLSLLPKFMENDIVGCTIKMQTPIGNISPTTLRYIKNALEINDNFPSIESVIEVGGGYGGLYKTLSCIKPLDYSIVDLAEPLMLVKKYLKYFGLQATLMTSDVLQDRTYDLFISNYALSECSPELQQLYFDKLIVNSEHIYITYNTTYKPYYNSFMSQLEKLFNITSYDEKVNNGGLVILGSKK